MNVKLVIAYDGTAFLGWQKTPTGSSIEEKLQHVLQMILQEPISLQAASRTDAGVHAQGQVVNFLTQKEIPSLEKLLISLNQLLPKDIAVVKIELMSPDFHPTLHCKGKTYHYSICQNTAQLPQYRLYSWHCPYGLDLNAMQEAIPHFIGEHDFSSFCNMKKQTNYRDYIRTIRRLEVFPLPDHRLRIEIEGDHFLYKMVRNIVGTLVYVARGKINGEDIPELLSAKDRRLIGITAPAHGLTLHSVAY